MLNVCCSQAGRTERNQRNVDIDIEATAPKHKRAAACGGGLRRLHLVCVYLCACADGMLLVMVRWSGVVWCHAMLCHGSTSSSNIARKRPLAPQNIITSVPLLDAAAALVRPTLGLYICAVCARFRCGVRSLDLGSPASECSRARAHARSLLYRLHVNVYYTRDSCNIRTPQPAFAFDAYYTEHIQEVERRQHSRACACVRA